MIFFKLLPILLCMLSLGACKEEYSYPNVLTEFADIKTTPQGKLMSLTTDRGDTFSIKIQSAENSFVPDTLYRMLTVFELLEGTKNELKVYSAQPIFSEFARPELFFKDGIKTDPVDIQSIWRSGNYLNFILLVQTKNKPHRFHFVDKGVYPYSTSEGANLKVLELTLYHDRQNDYEAFTSKYCFSIPLNPYEKQLRKGDIIRLHLNTYKEGNVIREFEY